MKANEEVKANGNGGKPADVATMFQDLLSQAIEITDAEQRAGTLARVAELSQQATERAKLEIAKRNEVTIGTDGQLCAANLDGLMKIGRFYADSDLVPDHYRNKPGNCAIAFQLAKRMKIDPMTMMQQSYIVHGRPGIQAKLYIALLNTSDRLSGRLWYEVERDKAGAIASCIACAKDADGVVHKGAAITPAMVKAEGWDRARKDQPSKWTTIPEQMYRYRAASFLGNSDFPDVTLGLATVEELEDVSGENVVSGTGSSVATEWVRPATGSVLGTGTVLEPIYEPDRQEPPQPEPVQTDPTQQESRPTETMQPEYVGDVSQAARQETAQHTVLPTSEPVEATGNEKLDGYLTAISLAPAGGVDQIVKRAMDDQELNDAQFEVIKTAAEKRKVNLQRVNPGNGDGAKFVAQIRTMKSPTGVKSVVAKAEAANLPQEDLESVYAAATAQNQRLNGGRSLLKTA